jgi:hypothetical protein
VIYTAAEFMIVGPRALSFLFFFPLPTVPPSAITIPVLLIALSVIAENRSFEHGPAREALPADW